MAEAVVEKRWGKPSSGRSTLMLALFVALVGVVAWLLSERNARHYTLAFESGLVSVKKGILFPVGSQAFKTDDPQLAQAYAPFAPPQGAKLDEERVFDDRAGLDQALFELLARWAQEDIQTEKTEQLERGLGWLQRAEKLQQISAAQRSELSRLRAESGFFEARGLLDRAAETLRMARERLRLAAGSSSPHAGEAVQALRQLDPMVEEAYRAAQGLASTGGGRPAASNEKPAEKPSEETPPGASSGAGTSPGAATTSSAGTAPPSPAATVPAPPAAGPAQGTGKPAPAGGAQ